MAQRNPKIKRRQDYLNGITARIVKPWFIWQTCECCGKEYRRQPLFEITKHCLRFEHTHSYYGCTNCFYDINDFKKHLEAKGYILSEKDFDFMEEIEQRLDEKDQTLTKKELMRYVDKQWS